MKVVINACYGGFSISRAAHLRLRELQSTHALAEPDIGEMFSDGSGPRKPFASDTSCHIDIPRNDPLLVHVVEEMGAAANGSCARLQVVEIPDGVEWEIDEYDGNEHVAEVHRTWR